MEFQLLCNIDASVKLSENQIHCAKAAVIAVHEVTRSYIKVPSTTFYKNGIY